jgi:hypothetical protein
MAGLLPTETATRSVVRGLADDCCDEAMAAGHRHGCDGATAHRIIIPPSERVPRSAGEVQRKYHPSSFDLSFFFLVRPTH